jgi:predicted nucleic acid-binding protein
MNGRFFLDTNIFVYEFDIGAAAKAARASELIRQAIKTRRGVVSYQVVQEFLNVAFSRFVKPLPHNEAEHYLRTVFTPLLAVHSSPRLFFEAMRIRNAHRLSWYDSLIISAALEADCKILYSEDFQAGRKLEGIKIENPFA